MNANNAIENSLFSNDGTVGGAGTNEEVLKALLIQGVGREIREDGSVGKRAVLGNLAPKTRGLKRLLKGLENEGDRLVVRGADDAVDILEVILDIVNSKFIVQPNPMDMEE